MKDVIVATLKPAAARAPGLDLLRAAAILAVMLYHISSHGVAMPALVEQGWMGVDLFFVLSGYLIGWQILRELAADRPFPWRPFMLGRALRILPAYYAVLALYVAWPAWREGGGLQALWKYATFTLNLFPDWGQGTAYAHAWSLCVEEHFYLLLPVAVWLLAGRARGATVAVVAAAILAGGMLGRAWLWHAQVAPQLAAGDAGAAQLAFVEAIYNPTYTRLDGLLIGVMLAAVRAFRPTWWARLQRHAWLLMIVGAVILGCGLRMSMFSLMGAVFLFPLVACGCACLLAGAASPATPVGRVAVPGARLLATLAFSLYLTHKQVYGLLDDWLPGLGARSPIVALLVYALASVAVAALLYLGIERPGLRLRARLGAVTGGSAPPAPAHSSPCASPTPPGAPAASRARDA